MYNDYKKNYIKYNTKYKIYIKIIKNYINSELKVFGNLSRFLNNSKRNKHEFDSRLSKTTKSINYASMHVCCLPLVYLQFATCVCVAGRK